MLDILGSVCRGVVALFWLGVGGFSGCFTVSTFYSPPPAFWFCRLVKRTETNWWKKLWHSSWKGFNPTWFFITLIMSAIYSSIVLPVWISRAKIFFAMLSLWCHWPAKRTFTDSAISVCKFFWKVVRVEQGEFFPLCPGYALDLMPSGDIVVPFCLGHREEGNASVVSEKYVWIVRSYLVLLQWIVRLL